MSDFSSVENNILHCRLLRSHAWEQNPHYDIDSELGRISYAIMALRCTRCGLERFDYLTRNGVLNGRYYRVPKGYPNLHRASLVEIRREAISRTIVPSLPKAISKSEAQGHSKAREKAPVVPIAAGRRRRS